MQTIIPKRHLNFLSMHQKLVITDLIVYLFVLLFVYTATSKLLTIETFKNVLTHYPLIGAYHLLIAYSVPLVELVVAAFLVLPGTRRLGLYGAFGSMIVFLIYILYMFYSGSRLPCSCGGIISQLSWQQHIWFNAVLIALAGIGIRITKIAN
jgi:uncharacterized membrane protein YphA (DoxX/SURF4 family)